RRRQRPKRRKGRRRRTRRRQRRRRRTDRRRPSRRRRRRRRRPSRRRRRRRPRPSRRRRRRRPRPSRQRRRPRLSRPPPPPPPPPRPPRRRLTRRRRRLPKTELKRTSAGVRSRDNTLRGLDQLDRLWRRELHRTAATVDDAASRVHDHRHGLEVVKLAQPAEEL